MRLVGHVTTINRYPVKSMGGERLPETALTLQGVSGDRLYAFVQRDSKSDFPWLTGREAPGILSYAALLRPGKPTAVDVRTPSGATLAADSDELLAELEALSGRSLHRLANYRGNFDVAPVSLIALSTVRALATASGTAEDSGRYRMTFTVDTGGAAPFVENEWVGRELRIGKTARVAITEPDKRCVMITLDHPTSAGSPRILRAAAELNDAAAGVYGSVTAAGDVREGDTVSVED